MIRFILIGSKISMIVLMFFFSNVCFSQTNTLNGVIWDQVNKIPISYTSVALIHKNAGTTSIEDGKFTIKIDTSTINDTLAFSRVGYKTKRISVKELSEKNSPIVFLTEKPVEMNSVTISSKKYKTTKHKNTLVLNDIKYKRDKVKIFWLSNTGGSQMAVLYQINSQTNRDWYLDKIRITLANGPYNDHHTMKFNIRLYDYDSLNKQPGLELYNKPIIVDAKNNTIKEIDLKEYGIQVPDKYFFISVEWLFIEENKYTLGDKNISKSFCLPILVELKESRDIIGVWDFNFNQKWHKREERNGNRNSLDISVTLRD